MVWNSLTPGKKRGYVHRIATAKRDDTREKRVFEVLDNLMDTEETKKPNKAVDSTAARVTPPASSLRSGQESRHGQP